MYAQHLGQSVDNNININNDRFGSVLKNVMKSISKKVRFEAIAISQFKDGFVDTRKKSKKSATSDQSIAVVNSAFATATAAHSTINDEEKDTKLKKNKSGKELKHVTISTGADHQIQPSAKSGKMRESLRSSPSSPNAKTSSAPNSPTKANPRTLKQSDYQLDYVPHTASDRVYFFNSDAMGPMKENAANSPISHSPQRPSADLGKREKLPNDPYEMDGDEIFLEKIYYGIAKKTAKAASSSGSHSKKNLKPPTANAEPTASTAASNSKTAIANYAPNVTLEGTSLPEGTAFDPERKNPECTIF